jgi:predicted transcriptional regulator of viral defense system
MTFNQLKQKASDYPVFCLEDIFKWFPDARRQNVLNQLSFWTERRYLQRIKKGVYKLADYRLEDHLILVNFVYFPAYVSLETALNYHGLIPDVSFAVTAVTVNKTKEFHIEGGGIFTYHHLKPELFFGFDTVKAEKKYTYNMALPEKALFDYLYLKGRGVGEPDGFIEELRLSLAADFGWQKFRQWAALVPARNKNFHRLVNSLIKKHNSVK